MSSISKPGPGARRFRSRSLRLVAGVAATTVTVAGVAFAGGQGAGAATAPAAQSVGNFLDATLGGQPLDPIAKLKYANAVAPGSQSVQNPLDATLLNALNLPLTGALQLPQLLGITLGAANQVAVAHPDGYSYGASGLVNNSGGVSVGGNNAAFPASATIDLTGSNNPLAGIATLQAKIGAVSALAQTPVGVGKPGATSYNIAGVQLVATSPLLKSLLSPVAGGVGGLGGLLAPITQALGGLLPAQCQINGTISNGISLANGGVVIDIANASLTIDVEKILQTLKLDLNNLPANTDLLKYVIDNLPTILSQGLGGLLTSIINPLTACLNVPALGGLLKSLTDPLTALLGQLGTALQGVTNGLGAITDGLANLVSIGVNVQPNGPKGTFTSAMQATPKQGTPVVAGQTIVRAVEVKLLGGKLASVALANAAAGPSAGVAPTTAPAGSTSAPATSGAPNTNVPTGVPAGKAAGYGVPTLPLVLAAMGLLMAAGGAAAWKVRGKHVL